MLARQVIIVGQGSARLVVELMLWLDAEFHASVGHEMLISEFHASVGYEMKLKSESHASVTIDSRKLLVEILRQ